MHAGALAGDEVPTDNAILEADDTVQLPASSLPVKPRIAIHLSHLSP